MNNIQVNRSQRVKAVLNSLGISQKDLAKSLGLVESKVSKIVNGYQELSYDIIEWFLKSKPDLSLEWLIFGTGEMLKSEFGEKKSADTDVKFFQESCPYFNQNLSLLIEQSGASHQDIAAAIGEQDTFILTRLIEGSAAPTFAQLHRLRAHFGVGLDELLYEDLTNPERMRESNVNVDLIREEIRREYEARMKKMETMLDILLDERERKKAKKKAKQEAKINTPPE